MTMTGQDGVTGMRAGASGEQETLHRCGEKVMSDHTPAPWLMLSSPYDDGTPYHRISAGKPEIYERETGKGFQIGGIMSEADARLIVAAPVLLEAIRDIAEGNCPGALIDATNNATSKAEAQRIFHMAFSNWMQQTARAALKTLQEGSP